MLSDNQQYALSNYLPQETGKSIYPTGQSWVTFIRACVLKLQREVAAEDELIRELQGLLTQELLETQKPTKLDWYRLSAKLSKAITSMNKMTLYRRLYSVSEGITRCFRDERISPVLAHLRELQFGQTHKVALAEICAEFAKTIKLQELRGVDI